MFCFFVCGFDTAFGLCVWICLDLVSDVAFAWTIVYKLLNLLVC